MQTPEILRQVKKLVILALFSDDELMNRLVLKGGNLLDVVYELSARASVDVDFSMDGEFEDLDVLRWKVSRALETTFREHGYVVFDFRLRPVPPQISDDMKDFWGGYKVEFKMIATDRHERLKHDPEQLRRNAAVIGKKNSTVFKVDISRHEFCEGKERYELDDRPIYGYSPSMFVAEKLRAVCQQMDEYARLVRLTPRPRARDFVDVYIVSSHYGIDWKSRDFHEITRKVFRKKRVPLCLIGKVRNSFDQHADDFSAVAATVHRSFRLESFEFYHDYLCRRCDDLMPLWHE